jgi:hypothetical protein
MLMRAVGAAVLIVALAACAAKPAAERPGPESEAVSPGPAVPWQGHELREVTTLSALPASIRKTLGVDRPGLGGVADRGQPFNATDVIFEPGPWRRFITAGRDGNLWLVVLEHGGIGYSVQVMEFAGGDVRNRWVLFDTPKSLEDAVRGIADQRPEYSAQ